MRKGAQTLVFESKPVILSRAAIGGKKEGEGPLAAHFDFLGKDAKLGQKTFEKAESKLQELALDTAKRKLGISYEDIDVLFAGDLLNQCISSSFAARGTSIPFLGLYGACSTMAESLLLAAAFVDAGFADTAAALTSSHFASAERQYRFPLAYGGQRTPTAQWTATAAGAAVLGAEGGSSVRMTHVLFGKMIELGVKDANNMGAAMAPEDVNLDPYIFGTLSAVFCMQSDVIRTHPRSFLSDRPETENRQSHLIPYLASSGILSAQMFFLSKHRR